jgi:prolyl oligopeptidase
MFTPVTLNTKLPINPSQEEQNQGIYPATERIRVDENIHGTWIIDHYRWLEEESEKTKEWIEKQHTFTLSQIEGKPHEKWLKQRFSELWRYDDTTVPVELSDSDRLFFSGKTKDQDRWVYFTKKNINAPAELLLDPNTWPEYQSLDITSPSDDGRFLAYGIAEGGDENPVIRILDLETGNLLPDTLYGRKQNNVTWLPNSIGFYYTAHPLKGTVPDGEEEYWNATYYHRLGTPFTEDRKVFFSKTDKECYHTPFVTEDNRYEVFYRSEFSKCEVFFRSLGSNEPLIPLATGFDGDYSIEIYQDKIYILTDFGADMLQIFVTDVTKPQRHHWQVLVPERKRSKINSIGIIEGRLYVDRLENACTRIEIYDLNGKYLKDVPLPGIGSAEVCGFQGAKPGVQLTFSSFFHPSETFEYDFETDKLTSIHRRPIDVDTSRYEVKQVWITSNDGTKVSMFLLHHKDIVRDGNHPTFLTGYGGFDICETPAFSTTMITWLEAGGVVAIPNLRGGGEYGKEWHEGGMKEKKQNVFDDFIAAAEYLILEMYTNPSQLAIGGGSNGGLLVGAAMTQRPELFRAVLCEVPLLDMVNYHKWGLANIWNTEYGSSDDPREFQYLLRYSPYHNVWDGIHYPATLITASENDSRVDPCHASKMVARLQRANGSDKLIMLYRATFSGHVGGTTLTQEIEQTAHAFSFLMDQLGMKISKNCLEAAKKKIKC